MALGELLTSSKVLMVPTIWHATVAVRSCLTEYL